MSSCFTNVFMNTYYSQITAHLYIIMNESIYYLRGKQQTIYFRKKIDQHFLPHFYI